MSKSVFLKKIIVSAQTTLVYYTTTILIIHVWDVKKPVLKELY